MNKEEFDKEFGNVEKTIKMPKPPTWEEFECEGRYYISIDQGCFIDSTNWRYEFKCVIFWKGSYIEEFEYTKEGYIKALHKIKELWLEEV